jgi:hypothetical protein
LTRQLNLLLLLVLLFGGLPFGWFMLDTSTKANDIKPVTIPQLRMLAASLSGQPPREARYETIGRRRVIGDLLAAGSGLRPVAFVVRAYELIAPNGHVISIDRGMARELAERHRLGAFDPIAQTLVDRVVATASVKLLLSHDPRHSGSAEMSSGGRTQRSFADASSADEPYAVAPGVVVIPADGIRRGECMVYARLSDGGEILFAGDVAPVNVSWSEQRWPARFMTTFLAPGDREQIAAWLRTVQSLKAAAPDLQIVAGHDTAVPRVVKHGFIVHPGI